MALLKIYTNNPTAAGTDGTEVSENGAQTMPISASLVVTSSVGASEAIKLAARCDSGYQTTGNVVLKFVDSTGTDYTSTNYKLAEDNNYSSATDALENASWVDSVTITSVVDATNTIFWAKLSAPAGATPANDTSISLFHSETIEAV